MTDVYGEALMAYHKGDKEATLIVESDIAETEEWPVAEFFHTENQMGDIERRALTLCHGRTLDVGAGSGSHTLWLQEHKVEAEALDISRLAVDVMRERGVSTAHCMDFMKMASDTKYDTLLMLMNGAGLAGTLDNLARFLNHCKELMADGGQIIMDSSDLIYLFAEEDGSVSLDLNAGYYGELEYTYTFGGKKGNPFHWLFVDQQTLTDTAEQCGLKCEIVMEDDHFQYLARLTKG